MRIGTAVPSDEELAAAPHHFIQNKSIAESYTVGDFEREALEVLESLFKKNPIQIMVGGSGLYVDALLKGMDNFPDIEDKVRDEVRKNYEIEGLSYLQNQLQTLDPDFYNKILNENPQTLQNPQRLMRFVEVCIGTGHPYSSFLQKDKLQRPFTSIVIGLEADREIMYNRINQRVDIMMNEGLLKEAQTLLEYKHLNALQTVGYRELFGYFDGDYSLDFAIDEIKKNTRRFSKRQLTWFKRTENVHWFDYLTDRNTIIATINSLIKA